MTRFQLSLALFLVSIIAGVIVGITWIQSIFQIVKDSPEYNDDATSAFQVLSTLFSPGLIVSLVILCLSSLAFRILAIVHVASAKTIQTGEKALWIIGLIIMGFITGILYLVFSYQKRFENPLE